ncbi:MAG: hypothetical protein HY905_07180 [Deltaproteobacteria bacterium]|nr:hypothetical protein [Deltaproteobacteria bacterium]
MEKLRGDERLKAVDAEAVVGALGMHLADGEAILGWIVLKVFERRKDDQEIKLAVVTDLHFLFVFLWVEPRRQVVSVRSTSIGRVRFINTLHRLTGSDAGSGDFHLDFAGPFEEDGVRFEVKEGWPTEEVRAFLAAIAYAQGWPLRRRRVEGDDEE